MALTKVHYTDNETVIGAKNLNDIQDEIIANGNNINFLNTGKVNKVAGKGLSTLDFTVADRQAISNAYVKPTAGVPKTDLSQDVQTSLDKADNSLQAALDETLTVQGAAADAKATGEAIGDVKSALNALELFDTDVDLDASMFQYGYIDGAVGGVPTYRSSTQRFVTKEGTAIRLKAGTVIHVKTSIFERYGVAFQITKIATSGTIESMKGLFYRDYVVPEDGNYILMFRTNYSQDIPSITAYLENVDIEYSPVGLSVGITAENFFAGNTLIEFMPLSGALQTNDNIGAADETFQEVYTSLIRIPTSKKLLFKQSLLSEKSMLVRYNTYDENGVFLNSYTPFNRINSSSVCLSVEFLDAERFVVFSYRSFGAETDQSSVEIAFNSKPSLPPFYALTVPPKAKLVNHRGYETVAPENSIPAFTLAGQAGAFGCETDVSSTADGVLIIMHDNTVDRTTDGSGLVTSLTYAQIQQMHIDAGTNVDQYTQEELIVPTFEDFIKICKRYGMIAVVEVKLYGDLGNYINSMLSIIYKYGMQNNVMILSSNEETLRMFRAVDENIHLTIFADSNTAVDKYKALNNVGVSIDKTTQNIAELSKYAHENKMTVTIYTAASVQEENLFREYFADFITTDTTIQST